MLLHSSFFHFLCLLFPVVFSTITKPGCQTRCGNLEIPFPFGLGSNCSIDPIFDIHCNTSTNPPKPYISITYLEPTGHISLSTIITTTVMEVTEISGAQVRVKFPQVGFTCFDINMLNKQVATEYTILGTFPLTINLSTTPYTLSDANVMTAFGCDDLSITAEEGTTIGGYSGGCVAYCSESSGEGYCPGNGCCQTSIPKGTKFLSVSLSDLHTKWRRSKFFPCSFAFIGEKGNGSSFTYNTSSLMDYDTFLNNNPKITTNNPLVLNWSIGSQNCDVIVKNSSGYACQKNSICMDSESGGGGYLCSCMEGYEGNPYLSPGCYDIDECENNPCHPSAICTNTPGLFYCSCKQGYYGDGKVHGAGCLHVPHSFLKSPIIKVSIGLSAGMGLLLLLSICFWLQKVLHKRKQKKLRGQFFKRNGGLLLQQQMSSKNDNMLGKTKLFPAKELEKATDHFNESRILGQGGQGTVYKGMLSDGEIVAIKKSKLVDQDQVKQFINEVVILSQINHRNVVKLLGCCLETQVPLLVYEFIPNRTLFDHIHDDNTEFPILWNMRLKIAADVAGALAYLHSATSLPIFHRDIKSSNILLDEKYIAKVSDFGTSRSVSDDKTHITTLVRGTFGYLDPEYFQSSQFTEKSDVYSFGVVLIELLTGQRPISSARTGEERSLAIRFLVSMEGNNLDKILDAQVLKQSTMEEVVAVARLAERCLNLNGKKRPTMKEVAMELESVRMSQQISSIAEARF